VHTKIGDEHFPVEMTDPNRLTSYYESYVLIPHLGPLLYSRLHGRLRRVVKDFAVALALLDDIKLYRTQFKEIPPTPDLPEEVVVSGTAISKGAAASAFRIDEAYARRTTRQPKAVLRSLGTIGVREIKAAPVGNLYAYGDDRMDSYKNILAAVSRKNAAISALVESDLMLIADGIVSEELVKAEPAAQVEIMVRSFLSSAPREASVEASKFAKSLASTLVRGQAALAKCGDKFARIAALPIARLLDLYDITDPSDSIDVAESCEWAFLRTERVTVDLGKPLFRGPLEVNCVAPKSELTLTETESRTNRTGTRTLVRTSDELTEVTSVSLEIREKMGILFDYGSNLGQTMSEQGYSQDTLKSEKRSRVEAALRKISRQNSTMAVTAQTLSATRIREYRTEGKDPKFATSELSFEVYVPAQVRHYLDDVSAVWAPRVRNPFAGLRQLLTEHYEKTRQEYVEENYVIDPLEPIPCYESVNRVSRDTAFESEPGTYTKTVSFTLQAHEIDSGCLFGEDIQVELQQHCDWYENCYDEDDRWMEILSVDRHGGDSWVDVTVKYHVDDVSGNDPDRTFVRVSIDKYKTTDSYRQELKEYKQTVTKTNPARRNAINVQARKYAALKRDELIRKYEENSDDLKDYAFTSLIKRMFSGNLVNENWSYYLGIVRSCIDWEKSRIDPEPCDVEALYESVLSPYHFLNVDAVRFFLPIRVGAEGVFFDTMRKVVDVSWRGLFDTVQDRVNSERQKFRELPEAARLLDSYDSELVLGRHLEAVLSTTPFAE
jgi:hypothetical protein